MEKQDFFASIEHVSGRTNCRPEHRVHNHDEVVLEEGASLAALHGLFNGIVELRHPTGKSERVERRQAERDAPTPFLGAEAYFSGGRLPCEVRAIGKVEIVAFDTPMLHRLGRDRIAVPLIRELARASNLAQELRALFHAAFVRTRHPGFNPAAPHMLLSHAYGRYCSEYHMFAQQLFEKLMRRRMSNSPRQTTRLIQMTR